MVALAVAAPIESSSFSVSALGVAVASAETVVPVVERVVSISETTDHSCNTQAVTSCLLPYPSSQYLVPDDSTATGVRVAVPADILDAEITSQFGPGASVDDAFGDADGFSALSPVAFELPDPVDPATLPTDGGTVARVVDLSTGLAVPMRWEVSKDAARLWAANRIVVGWPMDRFEFGGRYVAVLSSGLRTTAGAAVRQSPGLDPALATSRLLQSRTRRLNLAAAAVTADPNDVIAMTSFVVRSQRDVTDEIDRLAGIVRSQDHPIRNLWVTPSLIGGAQIVSGQVRVTDFRDADGVIRRGDALSVGQRWVEFMMVLPQYPAGPRGAPVAIYGHGLTVQRETMSVVAGLNAAHGIATVGIDIPNHGSRSWNEGGFLLELTTPWRFGRLASMPLQGEMDQLSLMLAIRDHFGQIDVFPVVDWFTNRWGDGRPDLDPDTILYEGTSMGAFLGAQFVALAPELDGAFLQVGGTGILDTLFHSVLWPLFTSVLPAGATAGDSHALLGAAGMLLDSSENAYLLDRIRANGTPFFLSYAQNDGVVPNTSSERMARLLGLPLLEPVFNDAPGLTRTTAWPAGGSAASQIPTSFLDGNVLAGLLAHTYFTEPRPMAELNVWVGQRLVEAGIAAPR